MPTHKLEFIENMVEPRDVELVKSKKNTIRLGILCYDLQSFTDTFIYNLGIALGEGWEICAFPLFYNDNQKQVKSRFYQTTARAKHLRVKDTEALPEGLTASFNLRSVVKLVYDSELIMLHGLQGISALAAAFLAKIFGKKVVTIYHSLAPKYEIRRRWWVKLLKQVLLSLCTAHISQTKDGIEVLEKIYKIPRDKIFYSPFTPDVVSYQMLFKDYIDVSQAEQQRKTNESKLIFLFVGNIIRFKGVDDLIEVARQLKSSFDFEIRLAGPFVANSNTDELHYLRLVERLDLKDHIKFTGTLNKSELVREYINADVFVLPTHKDCTPKVIVEAALAGKPIITTDVHSWNNTLTIHNKNAIVVEPGDIEQLKSAFLANRDSELRTRFGKISKELVMSYCNVEEEMRLIQSALLSVVSI